MRNEIVAIAQQQAQAAIRRAAVPAALGLLAAVLFLFTVIALFAALFFWQMPIYGPLAAALIVAAVAFVLGLIAVLLLMILRRPKPKPAPAADRTLEFVSLLAQSAPSLAPRQVVLTAVLLAFALGLKALGKSAGKK